MVWGASCRPDKQQISSDSWTISWEYKKQMIVGRKGKTFEFFMNESLEFENLIDIFGST
jgi:hypothetical protein